MKPYKTIELYQTADGMQHKTADAALKHLENGIAETFKNAIMKTNKPGEPVRVSNAEAWKITDTLMQNRGAIFDALMLERWEDGDNENSPFN